MFGRVRPEEGAKGMITDLQSRLEGIKQRMDKTMMRLEQSVPLAQAEVVEILRGMASEIAYLSLIAHKHFESGET